MTRCASSLTGRRGGRRNRRRNGNGDMPTPVTDGEPSAELQHAVDDLDRPAPPYTGDRAPAYAPPAAEEPLRTEAAAGEPEAPRRRSTVREPAQFSADAAPPSSPPPAPVISSTASEETGTPKRGWWAKRLIGDKD